MTEKDIRLAVDHVSDTAFLVAMCRAAETLRQDSAIQDPFAAHLAAPKADQLEKLHPLRDEAVWLMTVRTHLLDRHILKLVSEGTDTVVNLAAGLDSRPYRLKLPSELRWIEADLPEIIEYKTERLAGETPSCRLERIALDLADTTARQELFSHFDTGAQRTLVITEGLLPYLTEPQVGTLATSLHETKSVSHWLTDITTEAFIKLLRETWQMEEPRESKVALKFAPLEGAHYFDKFGWRVGEFDSFMEGSKEIGRQPPLILMRDPNAAIAADDSGIALLVR